MEDEREGQKQSWCVASGKGEKWSERKLIISVLSQVINATAQTV